MTAEQVKPGPALASARTNPFRRNRNVKPLAQDDAQRQGAISALAFELLGGRDAALDFLNREDAILSGRPIAVATQSEAGYASVERELRARSSVRDTPDGG
ncbi:antitoxin Xre/MbcA/ParS toxin-binding domain-containing protein [Sphingopyxis sp. JAI128]|uniref:antitoxin Xre/MbcA/ParS toxin-binding domain-containing protein n=1 Tax=Sphingopyxis sp. JAI128 TaxID=2723066 RepID=UPI0016191EDD|nr:antitoxin Xre/MbcA/ParS toxin-binding domain-containing protein [Sphingopyxis sp. JAI128]MBB6427728.1 uncharacterized protein (DUF2384 family) [Sphingopyxis sp. JAI128]